MAVLCSLICCAWNECTPPIAHSGDDEGGAGGEDSAVGEGGGSQAGERAAGAGQGAAAGASCIDAGGEPTLGGAGGDDGGGGAPASRPLRVTVLDPYDVPTPNAAVVFYDPNGQAPVIERTGPDGVATHEVDAGSVINVVLEKRMEEFSPDIVETRQVTTIFAVEPGDDLLVRNHLLKDISEGGTGLRFQVQFPPLTGAGYYTALLGCPDNGYGTFGGPFSNQSPMSVDVPRNCLDAHGKLTLVMQAYGADDERIAYSVLADLQPLEGSSFSIDSWTSPVNYDVPVRAAPPTTGSLVADATFYASGRPSWWGRASSIESGTLTVKRPAFPFDAVDVSVGLSYPKQGEWTPLSSRISRESPSGSRPVDVSELLPPLRPPVFTADGSGLFRVRWEAEDALRQTDGAIALMDLTVITDIAPGAVILHHEYFRLVGPAGSAELAPPPLPAELATATIDAPPVGQLLVLKSTELGSYAALRHAYGRSIGRQLYDDYTPPPSGPGSVTLMAWVR
jgi:hypothetical protein